VVPTDVTEVDQCERLVDRAVNELGRLDILVNNAGGSTTKPIAAWTPEEWHQVVDLNLGSVWFLSRLATEPMLAQGKGAIVNISSGSSMFAFPIGAPYGASKAAVNNLTASFAAAWTPKGIRVNALAVGAVRTEMLLEDGKKYGLDEAALGAGNAMGRIGEPDEIGYAVLYFASDASSYCSGQTLRINGGP
jgi:NAD(P)-dependent dehydrogenase (short-subunit alcohol dehydrogenase family)